MKSRKILPAEAAGKPATAELRPRDPDLAVAACNVMMRIHALERAGDDRDSAVETALDELCYHLSDMPEGVTRRLLVTALLRMSIRASVGIQGLAYTIDVLTDMTANLTGTGMAGRIN